MAHRKCPRSGLYDTAPSVNFFSTTPDYWSDSSKDQCDSKIVVKMSSRLNGTPAHLLDATLSERTEARIACRETSKIVNRECFREVFCT
ncbi:unnamed protein product [Anisakis simplex]|uniref:DUF1540 domain-containing protein n=1 Tax=Anisakis simplex TaxID=6269 RepID=A0A0M3JCC9_ANISI|nr:unnamed protein product [Anisakis simplex]